MDRRTFLQSAALTAGYAATARADALLLHGTLPTDTQPIVVRRSGVTPFPHVWETCVGSDRAAVAFRQQWLSDIERTKRDVGIQSVPLARKPPTFFMSISSSIH